MKKPTISIIVPVYNTELYLKECLESLIQQTLPNIEILCIDDGSTDHSYQILQHYANLDSRIKIFKQKNLGPGAARNLGLKHTQSDYVMFCDSDDVYDIHACEEMYHAMIKNHVDLVMCDIDVITQEDNERIETESIYHALYHKGTLRLTPWVKRKIPIPVWGKLFKTKFIRQYCITFPEVFRSEDIAFLGKYISISKVAYGIDKKLYQYRLRKNSIMWKFYILKETRQFFNYIPVFQDLITFLNKNNILRQNLWVLDNIKERTQWAISFFKTTCDKKKFLKQLQEKVLSSIPTEILKKNSTLFLYSTKKNPFKKTKSSCFIGKLEKNNKKIYFFLGIPILKQKDTRKANKYYLLGLRIYKKRKEFCFEPQKSDPSQQIDSLPKESNKLLNISRVTTTIDPIFKNKTVPIVFNCDNNFVKYFAVTLQSILDSSSNSFNYDIIVLQTDISETNKKILKNMIANKKNFSVRFFNMSDYEQVYSISEFTTLRHVKTAAYYRLFIPKIFSAYSKIIYLDSDLIVKQDPAKLFEIDLKGSACAAVSDLCLSLVKESEEICFPGIYNYAKNVLNFTNWQNYFNSGVMVYDIQKILSKGYFEKFIRIAKVNNQFFHDQNVLNSVLQNDVFLLEDLWNVQINGTSSYFSLQYILNPEDGKILHFCSPQKPWNTPDIFCTTYWWDYAKKTPFYKTLLQDIQKNQPIDI